MRGFKYIGLNGELIALSRNKTSTSRKYTNTESYQTEVYSFTHPDYKLLELYRRIKLMTLVVKFNKESFTEEQLLNGERNLSRIKQIILSKGLEVPVVNETVFPSLQYDWVSDYISFSHGQMTGPVIPPGWCG